MNDKYNRAQFEQYAESQGLRNFEYDQDDASRYRNPFTQCEWNYWVAALECVAQAARATPAQPVPVAKYTEEMRQAAEIYRIELQQMFDVPANPCEAAFKERTLSQGSQPKEWDDTAPVMVWYGYCEFKKGYEASQPSPSSVGAAIRALPLPEPFNPVANQWSFSDLEQGEFYLSQDLRALLSEAAALAEQVQEQHWLPIESAPKDQRVLLWFPIFGNGSHVEFGKWDAQPHNKKPNPYWSGDMERTFGVNWYREYQPTHYMLPPAAPSIAQDGQKSEPDHG